uniref:Histone-lysine N-methyltransferase n=1 Tax=Caenorhabditis japonica TaxID=281687 RepID=A0A8R1E6D2_CAEJA
MDSDPYDSKFHHCSPLHSPLMCGWRRKKVTMKGGKRRSPWKKVIIYFAPCGKPLYEMPEVGEYLRETRSMFTIDCFTFSEEVNTEIYISVTDKKYVKVDDFSGGVEGIPIPLVNTVDDEAPPKMEYSKRRFQFDQTVSLGSINRDFCSGCSCEGDCSDATKCECQQLTMQSIARLPKHLQYNGKEKMIPLYENRVLHNKVISGMYECNDQCSCHRKACHNRVVQNNIKYPMQIFKTAQSGWGVRALTDIPSGSFICNYVGALLTNDLADQLKNDDQYFADLDLKDSVETHKMMENDPDIDADYGYGGDSEYNSEEEREHVDGDGEDSADDARDKTVVMKSTNKNGSSSMVETRQTRRKEQEEKDKEEKGDDGEEDDEEDGEESKKEQVEEVFNWDAYFKDSALFVVDAKQRGNLGRFLNHSCEPNVQVQHVLYDTHDLRLPWVAFFTTKPVKAGDELCWDYAYTVLNPDVERLSCHCGAKTCRRRLL